MTGRHRRPRRLSYERRRLIGGVSLSLFFAVVTLYTLNVAIAQVRGCSETVSLSVTVSPDLVDVVDDYDLNERLVDSCISVALHSSPSTEISSTDTQVWIPETILWTDHSGVTEGSWETYRESVVSNPIGVAQGSIDIDRPRDAGVTDPAHDAADLLWLVTYGVDDDVVSAGDSESAPRVRTLSDVRRSGGDGLQRFSDAAVPTLSYPMLIDPQLNGPQRRAADDLSQVLSGTEFESTVRERGYEPPEEHPPIYQDDVVDDVLEAWRSYRD
ncbi:hypothetical protein [Haloglycomyces albus]|uniref:hypothetical protein n=1 Tax=Haloglycomyces albus TaxID=526067 RepID=UPI00046D0D14|nr:hypothetical protein [Haloglycomyces albus]